MNELCKKLEGRVEGRRRKRRSERGRLELVYSGYGYTIAVLSAGGNKLEAYLLALMLCGRKVL
jgi:hypothetical protein